MKKNVIVFSSDNFLLSIIKYRLHSYSSNTLIFKNLDDFWSHLFLNNISFAIIDDSITSFLDLFYFCKKFKEIYQIPVLLISKRFYPIEMSFFHIDDILLKPFSFKHLDLKISSLLKSKIHFKDNLLFNQGKTLTLFNSTHKINISGTFVLTTKTEFKIFSLILSQDNFLSHKNLILSIIWGYNDSWSFKSNFVEMHVSKLKKKLVFFFSDQYFLRKKGEFFLFSFYLIY